MDFLNCNRQHKWRMRGTNNSIQNPLINRRINLIAAITNNQEIFISHSLGQKNMIAFLYII